MNEKPVGKGRFARGDRVRVKLGIHRGNYGTVRYVGGDDGTFYGVMLDTKVDEIGYFDDELEAA